MAGLKNENLRVRIFAHCLMIVLTISAIAPFILLVSSSLTSTHALASYGYRFWPREFSLEAYDYIFKAWNVIGRAYLITVVVMVTGVISSLIITTLFAYVLAVKDNIYTRIIKLMLVFTLLFSGGIVAYYIVWTTIFHIQDTIFALIVPGLLMNGFTVILVYNYFKNTISKEFYEAAEIDGANPFRIYWNIYIPLSVPILATIGMLAAIGYWNDWSNGLYFINDQRLVSIQLFLKRTDDAITFLSNNPDARLSGIVLPEASVRMAIAVIGILPLIIAYPFFQKFFVAGITLGGVKG